jgi:hypothetical protein
MVSFGKQVPRSIILRYEVILALEIRVLKIQRVKFSNILSLDFNLYLLSIVFPSLLLFHKIS